ncbi:unnamed protein product [Sphagnum troendelagicum]|uniref:BZIP transcription factor n=1 Tax=Sphagnum troendelagicum TaxID=128251 RepID=A0ABP0UNW3_9BRYO
MSQTQVTQPEEPMQPVAYTSSRVPSRHISNNSNGTRTNYRAAAPRHRASKAEREKMKKLKKSLHEANMQQVQQNSNSTSSTNSTISTLVQAAPHDQSISTTTAHRPGAYGTDHLATATMFQFNIMQCCCSIVAPTNESFEYNNTTVTAPPAPPPSSLQLDQYSPIEEEERGVMQEDQQQLLVKNLRTQCFITPAFQKRGAEYDAHIWSMPINFMLQVRKERKKKRNFILQFSHKFHFAALIF